MRARDAAKKIHHEFRHMKDLPEGVTFQVSTEANKRVIVTLGGVSPSWLWEFVRHGRHGIPTWEISGEAKVLHQTVTEIAEKYRMVVAELEGITMHSYILSVLWDHRITAPKEITI